MVHLGPAMFRSRNQPLHVRCAVVLLGIGQSLFPAPYHDRIRRSPTLRDHGQLCRAQFVSPASPAPSLMTSPNPLRLSDAPQSDCRNVRCPALHSTAVCIWFFSAHQMAVPMGHCDDQGMCAFAPALLRGKTKRLSWPTCCPSNGTASTVTLRILTPPQRRRDAQFRFPSEPKMRRCCL